MKAIKRKYSGIPLNAMARIIIHAPWIPVIEGSAKIVNINSFNLWLEEVKLPTYDLPFASSVIGLIINEGILEGLATTCFLENSINDSKEKWILRIDKIGGSHYERLKYFLESRINIKQNEVLPLIQLGI
jgi:hypothetical protein